MNLAIQTVTAYPAYIPVTLSIGPVEVATSLSCAVVEVTTADGVVEGAEAMAAGIPNAELVVFERSAHMMFVEEPGGYIEAVDDFLKRYR